MKWITLALVSLLSTIVSAGEWDMSPPTVSWSMAPADSEALSFDMSPPDEEVASFDMSPGLKVTPATLTRVVPVMPTPGYPVRGGHWAVDGYSNPNRDYLIAHLLNGQHAGKFDRNWLASLSQQELLSLHDDDHENRYRGQVVRASSTQRVYRTVGSCPSGGCPVRRLSRR